MHRNNRRLGLALSTLLVGACAAAPSAPAEPGTATPSTQPSTQPTAKASPEPTLGAALPTSTPSPLDTAAPVPPTIAGCPGVAEITPQAPFVDAGGSIGKFSIDLLVTRIEQRSGQPVSVTPPTRYLYNDGVGLVVGGHEFLMSPGYYYEGYSPPVTMESATVTLTIDGGQPMALPTHFVPGNENFNQVAVSVPDVAGHGRLAVDMTWTDKCFRLSASGSIRVGVVPTSVTADCALEEDAYWKQLGSVLEHPLKVDSRAARTVSPRNESKYTQNINPGIDAFIAYLFNKDDPAFAATPGSALRVEATNPALTLTEMHLAVFTRHSIAQAVKDYPPQGTVLVLERTPAPRADGSWRLRVPDEPGRYVATMSFDFESKCTTGEVWAVVNVDVTAPAPTPAT